MNSFGKIFSQALGTLHKSAGVDIKYSRGNQFVKLNAVVGKSDFQSDDIKTVIIESRSRDYLIDASALKLGGMITLPERGDIITEKINGQTYIYSVSRPDGQPGQPYRFSDVSQSRLRIHTSLYQVGVA